jgi:hypothetical protein
LTRAVEALRIALGASETVGAFAAEVVAKSETSRSFWTKFGFASLEDNRLHLYLPMKTVRRAFVARGGMGSDPRRSSRG